MVVAHPPGATTGAVGRRAADRLGAAPGRTIVVENRAGAGRLLPWSLPRRFSPCF